MGLGRVRRGEYRTEEEIDKWRERDPILIHKNKLIDRGVLSEEECSAIENNSYAETEEALEFARNSSFPEPEDLFEDMWANPIPKP